LILDNSQNGSQFLTLVSAENGESKLDFSKPYNEEESTTFLWFFSGDNESLLIDSFQKKLRPSKALRTTFHSETKNEMADDPLSSNLSTSDTLNHSSSFLAFRAVPPLLASIFLHVHEARLL
jgi:hypothetical protein